MITEQRLRRQHLVGGRWRDPVEAVGWLGAVQSQDFAGSVWGVGQRCAGIDDAAFRRLFDAGAVVRTHVLRPTWHLVAPADLRWLLALTAPRVQATSAAYYRKSELGNSLLRRCGDLVTAALEGGRQLTRAELCRGAGPRRDQRARPAALAGRHVVRAGGDHLQRGHARSPAHLCAGGGEGRGHGAPRA